MTDIIRLANITKIYYCGAETIRAVNGLAQISQAMNQAEKVTQDNVTLPMPKRPLLFLSSYRCRLKESVNHWGTPKQIVTSEQLIDLDQDDFGKY